MKCRICDKELGDIALDLGKHPVSNSYCNPGHKEEPKYPLEVYFCEDCGFLQIDEMVDSHDIFSEEYPYLSGCSSTWLDHCKKYADDMISKFDLYPSRDLIMEVASNDGCLLNFFVKKNFEVLGVEPSLSVAQVAINNGVRTDIEFLDAEYAKNYVQNGYKKPKLIAANNVIAHNPNLKEFVLSIKSILHKYGVFTVEFPHLSNLVRYNQFDTIYHEHYSYFSLTSIVELMGRCGLRVFDVDRISTHGGSLRVYVSHDNDLFHSFKKDKVISVISEERECGVYYRETYDGLREKMMSIKHSTVKFLKEQKSLGKRVVAYGAPAKGNTFLNYCGISKDLIEYTVDRSEYKVGKELPGSRIPIYDVDTILKDNPDYVFILPWNIKDEIMGYLGKNFKYITAIPEFKIYD